jgi:ubiquinone/menaquinone biosynthesis C-methylase UbiE
LEYTYLDSLALFGVGGAHPGGLQLTKNNLSRENIDCTTSILDVGCGTGQTSAFIAEKYRCKVTSLDSNKIMLEKANQRFQFLQLPIDVRHGTTENLPFEDGVFDLILSESVTAFTDVSKSIPEYRRVLKPSGVLLAIEMVLNNPISNEKLTPLLDFYGISKIYTEEEWYNCFKRGSFKNISIKKFELPYDELTVQNAADYAPSSNIDAKLLGILGNHLNYAQIYKDILGYRIFRCSV